VKIKGFCPWASAQVGRLRVKDTCIAEYPEKPSELVVIAHNECYLRFQFPWLTAWVYGEKAL